MMLPEGVENELLLNEEQMQDLIAARNKTSLPKTLSALAIKSVAEHFPRFVDVPDSPLKYLPNTIVQQLLSKIASDNQFGKIPLPLTMQVLGLLVNPNVTDLDCTVLDHPCVFSNKILNNYLVKHALKNCPKIRKIKAKNEHNFLPLLSCFKKSWNNLTTIIIIDQYFTFDARDMQFLQENFPSIEELTICLTIDHNSKTVTNHLVNMKRLHTLKILHRCDHSESIKFYNDVAGRVPSLQNFGFPKNDQQSEFIDLFGETYPCKKLLMDKLSITKGLKRKWPKNLSVKDLIISCNLSDTEIENLRTIECTLDLTVEFRCRLGQTKYKVLDCIGGLVKSLTIRNDHNDFYDSDDSDVSDDADATDDTDKIILERMLAACPNLKHFKFFWPRASVVQDPKYNMSPAAFKNYKSFEINCWQDNYHKGKVLREIFRNFLIGTEVCETLELENDVNQLQDLAQVALAYPESLQQLRELYTNFFGHSLYDKARFEKFYECSYVLLTCCHKLERIFSSMLCHERFAREVTTVNRHLATIQSFDPYFIQKYTPTSRR